MSTAPLTDFGFTSQPLPDTSAGRIAELVRLQKFGQRITSTLDLDELVPRIVDEVAESSAASKSTSISAILNRVNSC